MGHDVFISYATPNKPFADAICAGLEQAKARCWIAPRDMMEGVPYPEQIDKAIEGAKVVVVVLSAEANGSRYVLREVGLAVHHAIPIIPFKLDQVALDRNLKFYLNTVHWLDAMTPPVERHIERLTRVVQLLLAGEAWERPEMLQPPPELGPRLRRGLAAAAVFLAALPPLLAFALRSTYFYPSRLGSALMTTIVNVLVLAGLTVAWPLVSEKGLRRWAICAGVASVGCLLVHQALYSAFVFEADAATADDYEVGGFRLRPEVARQMEADSETDLDRVLGQNQNKPFNVWVPWTVVVTRVAMLAAWLGFFAGLSAVVTILVLWAGSRRAPA